MDGLKKNAVIILGSEQYTCPQKYLWGDLVAES